jgi:2-hydroxychromene-2-carboxylate isomerase
MTTLDFYFDFGSPTAYLAYQRLRQLESTYALTVNYKPMLLGGVFKATNNQSPAMIPVKAVYMAKFDLPRFARRYGVPFCMNSNFPINTLPLMRGAHAAMAQQCLPSYCQAVFEAMWIHNVNLADPAEITNTLTAAGLNADALLAAAQAPDIKNSLIATTEEAIGRGAFGAPTLFIDDEMFFGQDRLDFIEDILKARASVQG